MLNLYMPVITSNAFYNLCNNRAGFHMVAQNTGKSADRMPALAIAAAGIHPGGVAPDGRVTGWLAHPRLRSGSIQVDCFHAASYQAPVHQRPRLWERPSIRPQSSEQYLRKIDKLYAPILKKKKHFINGNSGLLFGHPWPRRRVAIVISNITKKNHIRRQVLLCYGRTRAGPRLHFDN